MTRSPLSASVSSGASGEGAWRSGACGSATSQICSAIARHQQRIERARCLALGAFGPSRLGGLAPGKDVEVQPCLGGLHESAQEQRGGDRAAEVAGGYVIQVRHLRIEQLVVGPPERHAPQRIVLALPAAREV